MIHAVRGTSLSLVAGTFLDAEMMIGMCMFAPACNTTEQITCHRYKPSWQKPKKGGEAVLVPVRVTHVRGYYREYSTLYQPNTTTAS